MNLVSENMNFNLYKLIVYEYSKYMQNNRSLKFFQNFNYITNKLC